MEIGDGFSRFDNIRDVAYNCRSQLDRKKDYFHEDLAKDTYMNFLKEKAKNSTIADTAMYERLQKNPIKNRLNFYRNLNTITKSKEVRKLEEEVSKRLNILYPKTEFLRDQLIDNGRVYLDSITPKLKGLKKFLLKLTIMR